MDWTSGDRGNIEDDRGSSGRGFGGGGFGMPIGIGGFLLLLVLSWATGTNLFSLLSTDSAPAPQTGESRPVQTTPEEERQVDFVDAIAGDVQATWAGVLGNRYERTKVALFRDEIRSACGVAESATGPFYCPGDEKVYLDLSFFAELSRRFGAPGDFARAYVIAHEFGHHVQHLLGIDRRVAGSRTGPESGSVALELQADCFAGVWGHAASQPNHNGRVTVQAGDVDEGLRAAAAVGDDRLQRMATGRVQPERFTHGTSAQRTEWFRRGMDSGDLRSCDTFSRQTQ